MNKLILLFFLIITSPLSAQGIIDPDKTWDTDQWHHATAGAALDIVARGPWIAPSWRQSLAGRLAIVMTIGVASEGLQVYEANSTGNLGKEGYGFGLLDLAADLAGALAVEGIVAIIKVIN